MGVIKFTWVQLELSERGTVIGDSEMIKLWCCGFVLILTGVHGLAALSIDSVVDSLEFHDALDGAFT